MILMVTVSPLFNYIPLDASPVFIPLGVNPVFIPLGARPSPNIARNNPFPPLAGEGGRRPEGGNKKPGFLPLATVTSPVFTPLGASPVFTPLGASPVFTQLGARPSPNIARNNPFLPLAGEGGRRPKGGNKKPGFLPLAQAQCLSRLARAQCLPRLARVQHYHRLPHSHPKTRTKSPSYGRGVRH